MLLVAISIPIAAAVAAWHALRRINISPLGVTRRVTPPEPADLACDPDARRHCLARLPRLLLRHRREWQLDQSSGVVFAGVFLIMIGLVIAGPWLTMIGSRVMARRAGRARASSRPGASATTLRGAFRAISGLVLAVFVGSCAIGIITTIVAYNAGATGDTANSTGTVVLQREQNPSIRDPRRADLGPGPERGPLDSRGGWRRRDSRRCRR